MEAKIIKETRCLYYMDYKYPISLGGQYIQGAACVLAVQKGRHVGLVTDALVTIDVSSKVKEQTGHR